MYSQSIECCMNKHNLVYLIYHDRERDVTEYLESLEEIQGFEVIVSIELDSSENNHVSSDKRTRVSLNPSQDSSFTEVDSSIQEEFDLVWFDH